MIELLEGYEKFVNIVDDVPNFDSENFVNFKQEEKLFYMEFCQTQIFRQFLQNDAENLFVYFHNLKSEIKNGVKKNIFSKQFKKKYQLTNKSQSRRRSISNETNYLNRLISLNFTDVERSKNLHKKKPLKNIYKNEMIKILTDYGFIFNFKDNYSLYPYFLDYDKNIKISNKSKSEILMNHESLKKYISSCYLDEEIHPEINDINIYESNNRLIGNLLILDINKRIYQKFRFLNMNNMSDSFVRYSIPDDYYNLKSINNSTNKLSYNLKSIILEITQKLDIDSNQNNNFQDKIINKKDSFMKISTNETKKILKSNSFKRKITLKM